jgi:ribonuclease T
VTDEQDTAAAPAEGAGTPMSRRFRGFLPVIVDVETGGFISATDALLEVAAVLVRFNSAGDLEPWESHRYLVKPFPGSRLDPASLQITGIDPFHPLRPALDEAEALRALFQEVRKEVKLQGCSRAILVGHNSFFDMQFLNAAIERTGVKRSPFHPFSSFDTATLAGVAFGQTVLGRAVVAAGFEWHDERAHSSLYDAEVTAKLFCTVVNRFRPVYEAAILDGKPGETKPAGSPGGVPPAAEPR